MRDTRRTAKAGDRAAVTDPDQPAPQWRPTPTERQGPHAEAPTRNGYTKADLGRLTRKAALGSRWRFIGFAERADVARFAIVEHLLIATNRPDFWDLVNRR
jgi:hypothetical protein